MSSNSFHDFIDLDVVHYSFELACRVATMNDKTHVTKLSHFIKLFFYSIQNRDKNVMHTFKSKNIFQKSRFVKKLQFLKRYEFDKTKFVDQNIVFKISISNFFTFENRFFRRYSTQHFSNFVR